MKLIPRALAKAIAAVLLLQGGQAAGMTLNQAYEAALKNDPTFLAATQEAAGGLEYRNIGRANLLPNAQANYSLSRNNSDLVVDTILGPSASHPIYYSRSGSVSVRQPLYAPQAWALYKQGAAQSDYAGAQFDARTQEMILRVTGAYCDALFARDQVRIATIQRDMYLEQKHVNDHLFEKGEGTKTDMLETQARLDLAEAQVLEAEDNQTNALHTLSTLVGEEVTVLDTLNAEFRLAPLVEGGYDELRRVATLNNPEIVAQTFALEAAKQEVAKNQAGHKPRLDMVLSFSKSNAETLNTNNQRSTERAIGIQLNVPLYSGGQISALSRQAVAGQEKARNDLQATTDKVLIELRKQYLAVVSSRARIAALNKAVGSGNLLVTATEQSIKGGVRINLDLLNARQQLYTSERDLAQAHYNYLVALMKMRAAAGALGAADIREITAYFR